MANKPKAKPYGKQYKDAMMQLAVNRGHRGYDISVLGVLLDHRNYDTGQSRPGIERIRSMTGASENTMQRVMKSLRDAQLILPLAYLKGGRRMCTCYGFALPAWSGINNPHGGGGNETLNPPHDGDKPPPSRGETPPMVGGPTDRTVRTGNEADANAPIRGAGAASPLPTDREDELRKFSADVAKHGYGRARELQKLREDQKGGAYAPL